MLNLPQKTEKTASIGAGVIVQGVMKVPGRVHVDGSFSGELSADTLIVGHAGQVSGLISAKNVVVMGRVSQQLHATHLQIRATGSVTGAVTYSELEIDRGGVLDGQLNRELVSHTPSNPGGAPLAFR